MLLKQNCTGRPEVVKMVNDLLEPIAKMDGDSLPVSAFTDNADGQCVTGASAYEKTWYSRYSSYSGILRNVSSVTTVHLYVHMLQSVHSYLAEDEVKAAPAQYQAC